MFGNPIADCGSGGTSVLSESLGTLLRGGRFSRIAHSSSAMNRARCTGAELSGFWNCWQLPLDVALPTPC
jgi:hypothetical protein